MPLFDNAMDFIVILFVTNYTYFYIIFGNLMCKVTNDLGNKRKM